MYVSKLLIQVSNKKNLLAYTGKVTSECLNCQPDLQCDAQGLLPNHSKGPAPQSWSLYQVDHIGQVETDWPIKSQCIQTL